MAVELQRRRFTVAEYRQMAEAGILDPDEPVELLDGEIVQMSPIGSRHLSAVGRTTRAFFKALGDRAFISTQNPIDTDEFGEPEPDVALLRPSPDDYASAVPTGADVLLLVEVADSSLLKDRQVKLGIYASAGVPEVWIENLVDDMIEVYTDPTPGGYRTVRLARRGESIRPTAFPDVELRVDELLP